MPKSAIHLHFGTKYLPNPVLNRKKLLRTDAGSPGG